MENVTLTTELVNEILSYLKTQPYEQVYEIINKIFQEANENKVEVRDGE